MQSVRIPDLIQKKRDHKELASHEIDFFVNEMVQGRLEDSQLGAMLMAWYFNGMSPKELAILVDSMTHSGDTLTWPKEWESILVDKHSTGGVGDKVSLVLAPALAACGLKVPMISGRGLSFTGGTLDKLESIPDFNVNLSNEQMVVCLTDAGCCIAGQTKSLVPADRIMYAARDITATVDNINLATASIISKKAAENIRALVLDVKVGRAAFFKNMTDAREVAKSLVGAARDQGIHTTAVLTSMDTPIGMAVGNSLEVLEVVDTLRNQGPADLVELVAVQGGLLLHSVGKAESSAQGEEMIRETLRSGTALKRFETMLIHQNVKADIAAKLCSADTKVLPKARYVTLFPAPSSGYVFDIDALVLGVACGALGASRAKASDRILPAVGMELLVTKGQLISEGQPWAKLHHETEQLPSDLESQLRNAITISYSPPTESQTRILEVIH